MALPRSIRRNFYGGLVGLEGGVEGYEDTVRRMQGVGNAVRAQLQQRLRKAAEPVAETARQHWAPRTDRGGPRRRPDGNRLVDTIRVGADRAGVYVAAGGAYRGHYVPYAALFEYRRNNRHPVFARGPRREWTWASQPHDPALGPSVDKHRRVFILTAEGLLGDAIRLNNLQP